MDDSIQARRVMIDRQLRPEAVTDLAVLAAMGSVAREDFVPAAQRAAAYADRSIPLGQGRSMMPPAAIGRLLSALAPRPGERALVVASAGGYAAALLRTIGCDVTEIDGIDAGKSGKDFDLMLVDGAVEELPSALLSRVAPHGRVGLAIADRGVTRLAIGTVANGRSAFRTIVDADVGLIPGFERAQAFAF